MADPNYNPGFFGWLWEGITNPGKAWNTFENTHLVPAANAIDNFTKPVTDPVNQFLTGNPVGQAIAPALQQGAGYSTQTGAHVGMQAPTGAPAGGVDYDAIIDRAVANEVARQPALSAPGATPVTSNPLASPMHPSLGTSGGGWSADSQAMPSEVKTMHDGTKYTTSVVNGKTVYTVVSSPKGGAGTQLDDSGMANFMSGRSYTPLNSGTASSNNQVIDTSQNMFAAALAKKKAAEQASISVPDLLKSPEVLTGAGAAAGAIGSIVGGSTAAAGAERAAQIQAEAAQKAVALQEQMWNQIREDQAPWRAAGGRALHNLEHFEQLDPAWSMDKFEQDPGYQFRLSEGIKTLQNSAAARGGLLSGNTLKGIQNYGQEAASQEYQNAYTRYNQQRTQRLNNLQGLAGVGQTANNFVGNAGQNYANNAGQFTVSGGNALASGQTNAANANASGYAGATNALINAIGNYQGQNYLNNILGGK